MRKKYLSALLFGALLFASAGTFTSCKDYDDDISNLQEQINTISTTLKDLEAQVGQTGVSSVTFDEATGVLTVVDAEGTHTYTVKTPAGEVAEVDVVIDDERNLVVNDKVIGQVGDVVAVDEDGELTVNGEKTGITVGKYAILENIADNMYTITLPDANGNLQTIQLPRAIPTDLTIKVSSTSNSNQVFTEIEKTDETGGINWGTASKDITWAGPKGNIANGQLLVGQQNTIGVTVLPANTELDKQVLKLVDIDGNEAPVIVTPVAGDAENGLSGSRAISKGGKWNLTVTMDNTITKDNMGTAFTGKDDTNADKNKLYALSVNGSVETDYCFVIDTDEKARDFSKEPMTYSATNIKANGKALSTSAYDLNKGIVLSYEDAGIYDYLFSFTSADENDAEKYGITLENNVLTASDAAANQDIDLNVSVVRVDGTVVEKLNTAVITVKFGTTTVEAETLPTTTYKVTTKEVDAATKSIVVDLGNTFSSLTAAEATDITNGAGNTNNGLSSTDDKFVVAASNVPSIRISYYSDAECKNQIDFNDNAANIKNIKYAKLEFSTYNPAATTGEHTIKLTLSGANGEIKAVNIPINVTLPTFDELFTKSGAWTENTAKLYVKVGGTADLMTLYKANFDAATFDLSNSSIDKINNQDAASVSNSTLTLKAAAIKDNALNDLAMNVKYRLAGIEGFQVESGKFTVDLATQLNGGKFVFYKDGVATTPEITGDNGAVAAWNGETGNKSQGLAFNYGGKDIVFSDGKKFGEDLTLSGVDNNTNMSFTLSSNAGNEAEAKFTSNGLTFSKLARGTYDMTVTITYKKAVTSPSDVYESFTLTVKVVNE